MNANIEDYRLVVDIISRLKAEDGLQVFFGIGSMGINGNEELSSKLLNEVNLSEDRYQEIIQEILMLTYNILENKKNNLILTLKDSDVDIEEKIKLVEENFLDNSIKSKFLLNSYYKTNIIDKFDWEIITKHNEGIQLTEFPIAVLRFRIKHPFSDIPPVEKTETFVLETISEEIDDLISELENIRNQLNKVSGREK